MQDRELVRSGLRGAIAAMAMTGLRRVTTGLGLVELTPPEEIAKHGLPNVYERVPVEFRDEALELTHWAYGAAAGAAFGALPPSLRRHLWAGPVLGLATWTFFESVMAPLLGLTERERPLRERFFVAADHVLYGLVVAGRPHRV